jgi:hypothetical protein
MARSSPALSSFWSAERRFICDWHHAKLVQRHCLRSDIMAAIRHSHQLPRHAALAVFFLDFSSLGGCELLQRIDTTLKCIDDENSRPQAPICIMSMYA